MSQPLPTPLSSAEANQAIARSLFLAAIVLGLLGCVALTADLAVVYPFVTKSPGPIWEWCRSGIQKLVKPGETFANGWAIALLLMAFFAVDKARRRGLLRIATTILVAGMGANIGKLLMARWRPKAFFDATVDGFSGGVLDSFHGWLPLASLGYTGQSVPSGHTATAVVLAIVLCRRWPHAWWAFVALAGMAIVQRLAFGHHYPSDCLWGAALACVVAAVGYHPALAGHWFDNFERSRTVRRIAHTSPDFAAKAN